MRYPLITILGALSFLFVVLGNANAGPQPKVHSTSTVVNCTPNPVALNAPATCTVTVTDLGGQGPDTPPDGTVTFSSSGTGNFAPGSCSLVVSGAASSSCSVSYTPTVFGVGTHTITANYGGGSDPNPSTGIVFNPSSGNVVLSLSYPPPTITSISPSTGSRGDTVSVTVTGSGFVSGGTSLNFGANITQSNLIVVNSTQITVDLAIGVAATTGARDVAVTNPAPGGGSSTLVNGFTVHNPLPVISNLSPSAALQGSGALTVTIDGSGFLPDSVAYFNGNARTTTFVNTTQLQIDLLASDTSANGSFPITVVNPPPGGGTSNAVDFVVTSSGGSFDAVEAGKGISEPLHLKLAGTAFSFDILATDVGRTSINTTFTGTVKVELLNASDNTGALDANGCRSSWTVAATLPNQTFTAGNNGRITVSTGYSDALREARFRVSSPATGTPDKQGCSTDAFSIRPTALTLASSLNNSGTSGMPTHAAGDTFTMTVSAIAGYDGTPELNASLLSAHPGAVAAGTVSGTFVASSFATGQTSGSFTYGEVGAFRYAAEGVYDDSFTTVDQGSDCTDDFSNTQVGGLYGCKFGNTAFTQWVGRFVPHHFDVMLTDACSDATGFTYSGQPLNGFTIRARAAAGTTTRNYHYGSGDAIDDNNHANTVTLSFGGSSTEFSPSSISFQSFDEGVFDSGTVVYTFTNPETAFTDVSPRATDTEGTSSAGFTEDTTEIRSGRLLVNETTSVTIADSESIFAIQAWQDAGGGSFDWLDHTDDSACTPIVQSDFSLSNFTGNLAGNTSISGFSYTAPTGTVNLAAPGSGNAGSVDLTVDLSARTWLQFDWDLDGTPEDGNGTVSFFDIYETEEGFIDRNEIVQ